MLSVPPPPPPIEPGSTYAELLVPDHLNPLSREKDIPPYLGVLVTIGNYIFLNTPFSGLSREIFRDSGPQIPPFPRKWECVCGPLMHSSGGGGELSMSLIR